MKKVHIIATGIVTGVGFRWYLKSNAERLNIYGFAKNKTQNKVEAVFVGKQNDVDELIKLARKGPSSAYVKKLSVQDYQKEFFKKSFDI